MRLIRVIVMVWLGLTVLICSFLTIAYQSKVPKELQMLGFDVCSNKPCFRGIVPGLTTWHTARAILNVSVLNKEAYSINIGSTDTLLIQISKHDLTTTTVEAITIFDPIDYYGVGLPSIGNFILMYGPPCFASFPYYAQMRFFYPFMSIDFDINSTSRIASHVRTVRIFSTRFDGCPNHDYRIRPQWRGFASSQRYYKLNH
jgi:hypothetical protein